MSSPRPRPRPGKAAAPVAPAPPVVPTPPVVMPPVVPPAVATAPPVPAAPPVVESHPIGSAGWSGAGEEYSERLVVPSQLALAVVVAIAASAVLLALGLWPLAIAAVVVVGGVAYYLGVQILTVDRSRIAIGQGRGDNAPHLVQAADVVAAEVVTLTWPQCFGLGLPDTVDTTRYTVRAGPAVSLTLRDGELLRISAVDPGAVLARIGR